MDMVQLTVHCEKHGDRSAFRFGDRMPRCPACIEEEIAERRKAQDAEREAYWAQQRIEEAASAVPLRYRGARLSDFSSATVDKVNQWVESAKKGSGSLMLFGPVGTGKTHLACCIARKVIIDGPGGKYTSQANYLREIRQTWDSDSAKSEESVFSSFVQPRVLILDDIGAARGNDNDILRVGELISERYDAMRPSVFVTNLTPVELRAYVGDRSYDRMRDGAVQLVMNGETRRKAA